MKTIIKLGIIALVLILSIYSFNRCSKSPENANSNSMNPEVTLKQEVYKSGLIDLYIEFWSNLSSRPLSEIQIACDERDSVKLLELANYNDEQILEFYDKVYLYSPQIIKDSLNV